jgi:uncharacterized protein (DUF488 family)
VEIATIGFTRSSARSFFERIKRSGAATLVDVRLNNTSQLAGFAKRDDLAYFLESVCGMSYVHEPLLAPTEELLRAYRKKEMVWDEYAACFLALLKAREAEMKLASDIFVRGVVLLCSEAEPTRCHRRLAAEYLADRWGGVSINHL